MVEVRYGKASPLRCSGPSDTLLGHAVGESKREAEGEKRVRNKGRKGRRERKGDRERRRESEGERGREKGRRRGARGGRGPILSSRLCAALQTEYLSVCSPGCAVSLLAQGESFKPMQFTQYWSV